MQIIGRQGRGCTPCGCPLHSHRSRGEAPMTRGSAGVYILDPLRVAEGGGKVRHPCGVEVKTSIFPQVIAAIAARPVAKKRGSLAGSGIPLCYRLLLLTPAGVQPTGRTNRTSRTSRTFCPNTLSSDSNTGIRKDAYGASTPGGVPLRWSCIPIFTQMQIIGRA